MIGGTGREEGDGGLTEAAVSPAGQARRLRDRGPPEVLHHHRRSGCQVRQQSLERREDITLIVRWIEEGQVVASSRNSVQEAQDVGAVDGSTVGQGRPRQVVANRGQGRAAVLAVSGLALVIIQWATLPTFNSVDTSASYGIWIALAAGVVETAAAIAEAWSSGPAAA